MAASETLEFRSIWNFVEPYAATPIDRYYLASWASCRTGSKTDAATGKVELDRDELLVVTTQLPANLSDDEQLSRLRVLDGAVWRATVETVRCVVGQRDDDLLGALEGIAFEVLGSMLPTEVAMTLGDQDGIRLPPPAPGFLFVSRLDEWVAFVAARSKVDRDMQVARDERRIIKDARVALSDLFRAIGALPERQRISLTLAIWRGDQPPAANQVLIDIAETLAEQGAIKSRVALFPLGPAERLASDRQIAEWLVARDGGTMTAQNVAANRSLARKRLVESNPAFGPLLDAMLPYRKSREGSDEPDEPSGSDARLAAFLRHATGRHSLRLFELLVQENCPRFAPTLPLYARATRADPGTSGLPDPHDHAWRGTREHLDACVRCRRTVNMLVSSDQDATVWDGAHERGADQVDPVAPFLVQRALARLLARPDVTAHVREGAVHMLRIQDKLDDAALAALEALALEHGAGAKAARTALRRQQVLHPSTAHETIVRSSLHTSRSRGSRPVVLLYGEGIIGRISRGVDGLQLWLHGLPRDLEQQRPSIMLGVDGLPEPRPVSPQAAPATVTEGSLGTIIPLEALSGHDLRDIRQVHVMAPPRDAQEIVTELAADSNRARADGRLFDALAYARQELHLRTTLPKEQAKIGGTLRRIGELHRELGQYHEASAHLTRALEIALRESGTAGLESDVRRSLAELHLIDGRLDAAGSEIERAMDLARSKGDHTRESTLLVLRARLNTEQHRHQDAERDALAAAEQFQSATDPVGRAAAFNALALVKRRQGDLDAAAAACDRAVTALASSRPPRGATRAADPRLRVGHRKRLEGEVACTRGRILHSQGEYERALTLFRTSLQFMYEAGWRRGEADALAAIGRSLEALGRTTQAERVYDRAREIFRMIGDRRGEGVLLGLLARLQLRQSSQAPEQSRPEALRLALAVAEEAHRLRSGDPRGEAISLTIKAQIKAAQAVATDGELQGAVDDFEDALLLRREAADRRGEAHTLREFAAAVAPPQAQRHLAAALRLHRETGDKRGEVATLARLGQNASERGQPEQAKQRYHDAVDIVEGLRADISRPGYRHSYFATVVDVYHELARLLASSDPAASLEVADAARARVLLDFLCPDGDARTFQPGDWRKTYEGSKIFDDNTAGLFYLAGDPYLLYVVTNDGITVEALEITRGEVDQRVSELRDDVLADLGTYRHGHGLYRALVEPALEALAGRTSLLLSLDGPLHQLPFALLLTEDGGAGPELVRDYALTVVQSLSAAALRWDRRLREVRTHAVTVGPTRYGSAADGDLACEASRVADILECWLEESGVKARVTRLLGDKAAPTIVGAELSTGSPMGILHLAAETVESPLQSLDDSVTTFRPPELLLSDDQVWSSDSLLSLQMRAELAVLSADGTALGALIPGEGVMSLARTFLAAGADSVCASSMPVIGDSATEFAEVLYETLLDGAPLAEAVRSAQLALADSGLGPLRWGGWAAYGYLESLRMGLADDGLPTSTTQKRHIVHGHA